MGKIRTRVLGDEKVEKKQKLEQKKKLEEKKSLIEKKTKTSSVKEVSTVKEKVEKKDKKTTVRGKNYKKAQKHVEKGKLYNLKEAVELLKKIKFAKFDEAVELHLNVESTGLKGELQLPHSTGKTVRIKIVDDALIADLQKGKIEFDILITHPSFMPKLAKFAKVLGPKGLMPNPKAGTISQKPEDVVKKFEKGTLRYKTESKFPLIHQMVGKISFDEKKLVENVIAFIKSVGVSRIKSAFIKTTMSPSIRLDLSKV